MEHQPWHIGQLRFLAFLWQRLALLERAADQNVSEIGLQTRQHLVRQTLFDPEHQLVFDIPHRMINPVETEHFIDRLIDAVGDLVQMLVLGRNQTVLAQLVLDEHAEIPPVRSLRCIQ